MPLALPFPDISPEIFTISLFGFDFALRWYALAYIVGIVVGWRLATAALRRSRLWPADTPPMTPAQLEELLTWIVLGILIGGRLGFVLIYQPGYYLTHPLEIPAIWQGGMSFHGGLAGVTIGALIYARRHGLPLLSTADALALGTPPGIFFGRLANFINAELWGRPTELPWGVVFPGAAAQDCPAVAGLCARHPSQLYEAALEGLLLGGLLVWLAWRRGWLRRPGRMVGLFIAGYGAARFVVEFVRQPDAQFVGPGNPMGYALQAGPLGLTMGQILSLPMIALGLWLMLRARHQRRVREA
ncbi:prolipoprotein diacylglyceryl transferase [Roseitranquillus sediminis]|uniref:prolipoprotein diacylglyceryl transferase n=1 Tax=Roseitranquillus sediminis TaxID=2809051 RepID=UPI001D0C344B|nr:prolipoprotein diacylglyceryl transferase [Roseitranquillus sediminis]MBM9594446.1 prolipoprotein diacylglyceryl transferase [Roseitranquillus sediminis]